MYKIAFSAYKYFYISITLDFLKSRLPYLHLLVVRLICICYTVGPPENFTGLKYLLVAFVVQYSEVKKVPLTVEDIDMQTSRRLDKDNIRRL